MDHPDLTVSTFMENPIGLKRVKFNVIFSMFQVNLFRENISEYFHVSATEPVICICGTSLWCLDEQVTHHSMFNSLPACGKFCHLLVIFAV